ncbi:MAG: CbbQ/NirQ/NorQ C-terminal domain-containing protein, partial [Sporomusaceae bacterium]|nr:CbbQ/NirQ/NorQ C-terminal domain-containing protein [Sporomusaceae bacterium]
PYTFTVLAKEAGFVQTMAAEKLGKIAMRLGAGRAYKGQTIDLAVGIRLLVQVGDLVEPGQKIACLYTQSETAALQAADEVKDAIVIEPIPQKPQPLLLGLVDETGFHPIAL